MKRFTYPTALVLTIVSMIAAFMVAQSCNHKKGFVHSPNDTIRTPVLYYWPPIKDFRLEVVFRLGIDSFGFHDVDSMTKKKTWFRENLYFFTRLDSVRDAAGKVIVDSAGHSKSLVNYYFIPAPQIKRDMRLNVDSMLLKDSALLKKQNGVL